MRRFMGSVLVVSSLALVGTAGAADLSRRAPAPYVPPAPPAAFNWSGCYIGGYVGGAWSDNDRCARGKRRAATALANLISL